MPYMNFTQPQEICTFSGQLEEEAWPDPWPVGFKLEETMASGDQYQIRLSQLSTRDTRIWSKNQPHLKNEQIYDHQRRCPGQIRSTQGSYDEAYNDTSKMNKRVGYKFGLLGAPSLLWSIGSAVKCFAAVWTK